MLNCVYFIISVNIVYNCYGDTESFSKTLNRLKVFGKKIKQKTFNQAWERIHKIQIIKTRYSEMFIKLNTFREIQLTRYICS